jgi:hypothetical protein
MDLTVKPSKKDKTVQNYKTKICPYCKEEFSDIDCLGSFERMVTCGSIECMGKRRKERLQIKKKGKSKFML